MLQSNLAVSLDDKYQSASGRVYLTGIQALVRLAIVQRQIDSERGLNTAGYISGYRGSPLGGFDKALWSAKRFLQNNHITFQPGVNEDLAATAIWGTQQLNLFPGAQYDGVFSMWYGKGPGVDRSGDVFKHANVAGTAKYGGVLALAGDDHVCKSSTLPHQSEYAFMDAMMPVLNPANVQEVLDFGLYGIAMSRFSGCWVGFKVIAETVDSSASIEVDPGRIQLVEPEFEMPAGGLNIRWPDPPLVQEERLKRHKIYAALAFAGANKLDQVVLDSPKARLGIVTTGKSYLDVRQALEDLGIDDQRAGEIGIRLYKVGMPWPLEREGVRTFARGLDEILVIEEKRAIIENQLKEQLYNWGADVRPVVVGEFDEHGDLIIPSYNEITPARIARVIAARLRPFFNDAVIEQRLEFLDNKEVALARVGSSYERRPHFCSGCPHNTSTRVPHGSRAVAGIGCHYMASWMDRNTDTFTQMGGEGASWIGQAPFTETTHIFQNIGDGTYFHSGLLAIRATVASGANITYKILFNDAVAMTGGQPMDGPLNVPLITRQVQNEGVSKVVVVTDEPDKYLDMDAFAPGVKIYHRREFDRIQRAMTRVKGTSVIVYDQTCAAEKRRRRKRGKMEDPALRVFINELVCEGCGDCSQQSNCLSVLPTNTEFGRKRRIDQSACNKDMSCLNGFCPSFVVIQGGELRKPEPPVEQDLPVLPEAVIPSCGKHYGVVVTGIGGTGVVTVGALLGMAAHLEGRGCAVLDMTGLAQKYGAVISHVTIADDPHDLHSVRIPAGKAQVLLGCDYLVAGGFDALSKLDPETSHAVVNTAEVVSSEFIVHPDMNFPVDSVRGAIVDACGEQKSSFIDASRLALALLGDTIGVNLFIVGYAWQNGLLPLRRDSIERAIELNGVAVDFNKRAFEWGRRTAVQPDVVESLLPKNIQPELSSSIEEVIERRSRYLEKYQDAAWRDRYLAVVDSVGSKEASHPWCRGITDVVARNFFKLMAYKDEYEVGRLMTDTMFTAEIKQQFSGDFQMRYHMSPPLFARHDPLSGRADKITFGAWLKPVLYILARLKFLRGTAFDVFGYTAERKQERRLIGQYEETVREILPVMDANNMNLALQIFALPDSIRGYGPVKAAAIESVDKERALLLQRFHQLWDEKQTA